ALFEPEVKKAALAARLVGRNLFDFEVFRLLFDAAADAGKIAREQWRGVQKVDGHERLEPSNANAALTGASVTAGSCFPYEAGAKKAKNACLFFTRARYAKR